MTPADNGLPEVPRRIDARRVVVAIHANGFVEVFREPGVTVKVLELDPGEDAIDGAERMNPAWRDVVWPCNSVAAGVVRRTAFDGSNLALLKEMKDVVRKHGKQPAIVWERLSEYGAVLGVSMVEVMDGLKELVKEDAAKK